MVRIDIWDVEKAEDSPSIDCGFPRLFEERYIKRYRTRTSILTRTIC